MQITEKKHWWTSVFSMGATVINKTKYGTAMDSILILVVLVTLPCLVIYAFIQSWILLVIACAPIAQFIRVYDYFMKKNPKMLRTEKHEEIMLRIASAMGQKGQEVSEAIVDALPAVTANDTASTNKSELITVKTEKGKK